MVQKKTSFFLYLLLVGGISFLLYPVFWGTRSFFAKRRWKRFWPPKKTLPQKNRPRVWVHALSLGEMYSAFPLFDELLEYSIELVCTTSTQSGMEAVQKAYADKLADIRFFPFDHPVAVLRTVADLDPDFFILVETDLWPFFMATLKQRKIPSLWVNVRISDKAFKGYSRLSSLMQPAINSFTGIIPQSVSDGERLEKLGVHPGILLPAGNTKGDRKEPDGNMEELAEVRKIIGTRTDDFIWICGSIHPGEEKFIAKALSNKQLQGEKIFCLLVPRYPEKSSSFFSSLEEEGISASLLSNGKPLEEEKVLIIDRMGILTDLYSLGDAAFVGGSLMPPIKGHNPLEPAMAGIPVMMGVHCEDFLDSFNGLLGVNAARTVKTPEDIAESLYFWIKHPDKRIENGNAGRVFAEMGKGTSKRAVQFVMDHLKEPHGEKAH